MKIFMEENTLKKIVMTAPSVARKKTPELVYRVSGGGGQRLFITVIKKKQTVTIVMTSLITVVLLAPTQKNSTDLCARLAAF